MFEVLVALVMTFINYGKEGPRERASVGGGGRTRGLGAAGRARRQIGSHQSFPPVQT